MANTLAIEYLRDNPMSNIGVAFGGWFSYLLQCERLGLLLGCAHLPHTDTGAGAGGDDQFGVGTYGTEDLPPFRQTLVHHRRLEPNGGYRG